MNLKLVFLELLIFIPELTADTELEKKLCRKRAFIGQNKNFKAKLGY